MPAMRLALALAVAAWPFAAKADWTVCNRSPDDLWIATAWDNHGHYKSSGWWKLFGCGGCKTVLSGRPSSSSVFLYAMRAADHSAALTGSNSLFCVKDDKFTFGAENSVRNRCAANGGRLVDFARFVLASDHHTTKLTGSGADGRVCID